MLIFQNLIMIENKHVEYKSKLTEDLEREVIAFLNSNEGGKIFIGVDKSGNYVGVNGSDQKQLLIKDRLKNNILPSCMGLFDVVLEKHEGKDIIKIIVAGGLEKPYYIRKFGMSEKGAFIRVGSSSEPMPTRMIETLFAKRIQNSIGKIKSPQQQLTFSQLQIYYQGQGKPLNEQFATNLELLNDDGVYNYVAYLMADRNNISIKFAKYSGLDRVNLVENNEYGLESLVKATHQVLDKVRVENKTLAKITERERVEKNLWHAVALREAIINALVHNDYSREIAPKFEIFDDRMEITSYGGLPVGFSQDEFFQGYSVPRNKEIMRIFRDLELVEQLGSGIPRILQYYPRSIFYFTDNFLRMVFPIDKEMLKGVTDHVTDHVADHVTDHVMRLISAIEFKQKSAQELMTALELKHRRTFTLNYLRPAMEAGLIEMTIPDKPKSIKQKYRLTSKGIQIKRTLNK